MIIEATFEKSLSEGLNLYKAKEPFYSVFDGKVTEFRASGTPLPSYPYVDFRLSGTWENEVFIINNAEEVKPRTCQQALDFLIFRIGIDKDIASKLCFKYDADVLSKLEDDLEGVIEEADLKPWQKSGLRKAWYKYFYHDLFDYFIPFSVTEKQVIALAERFEETALTVARRNPYILPDVCGVPFTTADTIALDNAVPWFSEMRISAALTATLKLFETGDLPGENFFSNYCRENLLPMITGNTCMSKDRVIPLTRGLLGEDHLISDDDFESALSYAKEEGAIIEAENGLLSRRQTSEQEKRTARNIGRLLSCETNKIPIDVDEVMLRSDEIMRGAGLSGPLSDEQANAVCLALNNSVSIITGGPGTGKTTIQSAILYLLEKNLINPNIKMLAPTGRAASRMEESSGYPASTIHSALGLDVDGIGENVEIDASAIIIDEFSMVDTFLADKLFAAIKKGTKVICIGDINQLPSVGAGSVLRELIESNVVPTALLTNVFRQKKGSSIADNAYKINDGKEDFIFDESFDFVEIGKNEICDYVTKKFCEESNELGVDNVCVLTPFRKSTDTGTDVLNKKIQESIHKDYTGPRITHFETTYMAGDKVMYRKNKNGLTNGDVGYIEDVGEGYVDVSFGEKKKVRIEKDDFNDISLAYAVTIHKSQGSEYKSVILVMDPKHRRMHKKNLVYTAVTRAKGKITVVGSKDALKKSVHEEETSLRLSMLSEYLKNELGSQNIR